MDRALKIKLAKFSRFLGDEKYLKLVYRVKLGKKLNIKDPQTFNEKIQWLKLYDNNPEYIKKVDKFEVKEYVKNLIGKEYIIPTLGAWDSFEEIDFNKLPEQFVLKCNHDSGSILICKDKNSFNVNNAKKILDQGIKTDFYLLYREWPYKYVKRKIIAEEYLENDVTEGLHDYKVWCFNGDAKYVQYITGRSGENTYEGFFDKEWNLQFFTYHNPQILTKIKRPVHLEELLRVANKIAKGMPFARIDFYILPDDSIKFGEITLYPMAGIEHWHPDDVDRKLGDMITLPKRQQK